MWYWHVQPFTEFLLLIQLEATEFWIYSGIPAVIHVRPPPSSPLSSPPPIPAWSESGGKRVAETRNRISQARIIHLKMSLTNPISSFGNSFSTGFWSGGDWRWRWEGRRGWGTDMDHSWNPAVYPEFRGLQPYKEQKLRKRLYMPISHSSFTVSGELL